MTMTYRHSEDLFIQAVSSAAGAGILSASIVSALGLDPEVGLIISGLFAYVLNDCFQKKMRRKGKSMNISRPLSGMLAALGTGYITAVLCGVCGIREWGALFVTISVGGLTGAGVVFFDDQAEVKGFISGLRKLENQPHTLTSAFKDEAPKLADIDQDPLAIQINEAAKQKEKDEIERQRREMEEEAQKFIDETETQIMLAYLNMVKAPGLVQKVPDYFTCESLHHGPTITPRRLWVLAQMRDQVIANNNFIEKGSVK